MAGFVYLLKCRGRYKIGTAGDVQGRLRTLQTGNPFRVELVASARVEQPLHLEQKLHATFANRRVLGEWFRLTAEDVAGVLDALKQGWFSTATEAAQPDGEGFITATLKRVWRREVNVSGRHGRPTHWVWRKGSGQNRRALYGCKISASH